MTEWRVYGCGSASSGKYLQSSYEFVEEDFRLQIDFGNGALYRRCQRAGEIIPVLEEIRHLFITHGHADHTTDLNRHVVAWKYTPGFSSEVPVQLYATVPTLKAIQDLLNHSTPSSLYDEVFQAHALKLQDRFSIEGQLIETFPTEHKDGSCGIRINSRAGIKVAYTGDTSLFEGLSKFLTDLDLLVIECSFVDTEHHMHLNLEQVAKLAGEVNPKAVLLVHLYPEMEALSYEQIRDIAATHYGGELYVGEDGLRLRWDSESGKWMADKMF